MQRQTIAKLMMSIAMVGMFMMETVMAQNNNVPVPPIVEAGKYKQHKDNPAQSPLPGANKSSAKVSTRSSTRSKVTSKAKTGSKRSTKVKSS